MIAYSPLAQGLLSGRYHRDDRPVNRVRAANPLFLPDDIERASDLIAVLREVADAHSASPAQIALAWVIHHPAVAAIPGASSVEQLESNVAAAEIELQRRRVPGPSGCVGPVPPHHRAGRASPPDQSPVRPLT